MFRQKLQWSLATFVVLALGAAAGACTYSSLQASGSVAAQSETAPFSSLGPEDLQEKLPEAPKIIARLRTTGSFDHEDGFGVVRSTKELAVIAFIIKAEKDKDMEQRLLDLLKIEKLDWNNQVLIYHHTKINTILSQREMSFSWNAKKSVLTVAPPSYTTGLKKGMACPAEIVLLERVGVIRLEIAKK